MGGRYSSLFFLSRFQAEVDRLTREALELDAGEVPVGAWQPTVDIVETAAAILILVELPGCSAADLKLEVKGPLLQLSGSRVMPRAGSTDATGSPDSTGSTRSMGAKQGMEVRFLCMERSPGRFSREVQLFWPVNSHKGTALLADGLLTIEFPKIQDKRQAARTLQVAERPEPPAPELPAGEKKPAKKKVTR